MEEILKVIGEFGLVGGAFVFMLWQSYLRESKLMEFMNHMKDEMSEITAALVSVKKDISDLKGEK